MRFAAAMRHPGGIAARAGVGLRRTRQRECSVATIDRERARLGLFRDRYVLLAPDDSNFLLVIATADRGALHLEARYNYEALDTGSLFAGWTFAGGDKLTYELTPMLGAVLVRRKGSRRVRGEPGV